MIMVQKTNTPDVAQRGIDLSDEDIEAIKKLYSGVWCAEVTMKNWKEKGTGNYCQWIIQLPDKNNSYFTVTNSSLPAAVEVGLKIHWQGVDSFPNKVYND